MPYHRVGTGSDAVDLYYEVKGALRSALPLLAASMLFASLSDCYSEPSQFVIEPAFKALELLYFLCRPDQVSEGDKDDRPKVVMIMGEPLRLHNSILSTS